MKRGSCLLYTSRVVKKLLFVMNPYAGMRRANRFLADILSLFNAHGYEVTVHMTAGPGDGARAVEAIDVYKRQV